MKNLFLGLFFLTSTQLFAQFSIFGGGSLLRPFGADKSFYGFHLGTEIPKDDESSLYLKMSIYAKRMEVEATQVTLKNIDANDYTVMMINSYNSFNYNSFEGGIRKYLVGTYDNAFAFYGGTNLMGIVSVAKPHLDSYDRSKYTVLPADAKNISILSLAVGLNGGIKYTFPGIGTAYCDVSGNYLLKSIASKQINPQLYSPFILTIGIGFRREFY